MSDKPDKKELQEASYKLHRLMSKLLISTSGDLETRYEDACREVGRLQGIAEGIRIIENIVGR